MEVVPASRGHARPYRPQHRWSSRLSVDSAGALRALHVDPRHGTGVNWHLPGNPGNPRKPAAAPAGRCKNNYGVSRIIRGRSIKDQVEPGSMALEAGNALDVALVLRGA